MLIDFKELKFLPLFFFSIIIKYKYKIPAITGAVETCIKIIMITIIIILIIIRGIRFH